MDSNIGFTFRKKDYSCNICIDNSAYPCYVFVSFTDKDLVKEFGNELTIKTDCEKRLPKRDDYAELVEIRQAIFDAIKTMPEFLAGKSRMHRPLSSYLM
ncbi:MAG: hypothetical protein M3P17_04300, partial [Thermoproteota archaeon]|nr:hypothetical protein [Thermoproteota archaeon]